IVAVLDRQVEKEVLPALPGYQTREVDTVGGYAAADLESIIARTRKIVLEDISSEIDAGRVQTLFVIDGFRFHIPPVFWLVTYDADELEEIGAQRMCHGLVVMGIVGDGIVVLVGVGSYDIGLELKVEIPDREGVDVFDPQLKSLFVGPVAIGIMGYLVGDELVDQQLAIELCRMADIDGPVQTGGGLIGAAILLLRRDEKNDGVEIGELVMVGTAEHHVPEYAQSQPGCRVEAEMMDDAIFFGVFVIITGKMLVDELHVHRLIVELPYPHIESEEEIRSAIIAEEQASIAIPDEILIVSECPVEIFPGVEIDGGAVIIIVVAGGMKVFEITGAGYGIFLDGALLKIRGAPFLVIGEIDIKPDLVRDHSPESGALGIQKDAGMVAAFDRLRLLDDGIQRQEEVFVLNEKKDRLVLIKSIEPGSLAPETVRPAPHPLRVIHQQGSQGSPVY